MVTDTESMVQAYHATWHAAYVFMSLIARNEILFYTQNFLGNKESKQLHSALYIQFEYFYLTG